MHRGARPLRNAPSNNSIEVPGKHFLVDEIAGERFQDISGAAVRRRDVSFERPRIGHAKSLIPAAPLDVRSRVRLGIEIGPLARWHVLRVHAGPRMHDPPSPYQKPGVAGSRM